MKQTKRLFITFLIISMLLLVASTLLFACGSSTRAATIHLVKTEGSVEVADDAGKSVEPSERLGLYGGYQVGTRAKSHAWIDLDSAKLAKMDAESKIEIQKTDRELEILVQSGGLFFHVAEPLAEDETMNIRTSNMMVGIRGTCGWVKVTDQSHMQVSLLEGTVVCTIFDLAGHRLASETISAGESANLIYAKDGESSIQTDKLLLSDIPSYVLEEVEDTDVPAIRNILDMLRQNTENPENETSPENPDAPSGNDHLRAAAFLNILNSLSPEEAMYARMGDLNGDGVEDLLILGAYTFRQTPGYCFIGYIWNGSNADRVPFDKTEFMNIFGSANYSVYQERSTGTLYVRYLFSMDNNISCSFENAVDLIPMDYEYDYEAPGAKTESDRIFAEIQTLTEERFELLDAIPYEDIYNNASSLSATVEELKSRLSEETADGIREEPDREQDALSGQNTLPPEIHDSQFAFSSGAGAWATLLAIHSDGSFEGNYHDSNLGENGNGYTSTIYTSTFSGSLGNIQKTDDHTWSMTVDSILFQTDPGQERIENEIRYVSAVPHGLTAGDQLYLYAPDARLSELPEECLNWRIASNEDLAERLGSYCIYNATQGFGFFQ